MSFGKRPPGERPPVHKVLTEVSAKAKAEAASVIVEDAPTGGAKPIQFDKPARGKGRKAEKKSGGEAAFLALALGVMAVSAGGALAAPEVMNWAQKTLVISPVRPIHTVIAGLTHDQARAALAREAFPDADGRAFMTALATSYPGDHAKLLDDITNLAVKGGDRKDMMAAVKEWAIAFAPNNLGAISRAGAKGFDETLDVVGDALAVLETAAGECTLDKLQTVASNPAKLEQFGGYGSDTYKLSMHAGRLMIDLATAGQNAPKVQASLLPEDNSALQGAMVSLMRDPQVMSLVQMSTQGLARGGKGFSLSPGAANPGSVNVCKIGKVMIGKLKTVPEGTKSRLWAMAFASLNPAVMAQIQKMAGARGGV